MTVLLEHLKSKTVWVDHLDYSLPLLRGTVGDFYADATQLSHFMREAQSLLSSDVLEFDLARFLRSYVTADMLNQEDDLIDQVEKLLADEEMRQGLKECLIALRASISPDALLVIRIPASEFWRDLLQSSQGWEDEDDLEMLVMFISDLLRAYNNLPIKGVLLEDFQADIYEPLINMAKGYEWAVGAFGTSHDVDFLINAEQPEIVGPLWGQLLTSEDVSSADFVYWKLDVGLDPDKVLVRRKKIGGA
ncbi:MAG: hypothetical protein COB36_14765 [Alphaproteobacteria bacterium]|nr:MAG: hypothetical protein COB36_14765 [Alphaproteobacteria bacterium]